MNRVLAKFSYGFNCTFSEKAREEEATFPELIWRSQNPLQKIPRTNSGKFQGWQFYLRRTSIIRNSSPSLANLQRQQEADQLPNFVKASLVLRQQQDLLLI